MSKGSNQKYYLIGYDSAADMIKHYRVDKMLHIYMSDEKREGKEYFSKTDLAVYTKKEFRYVRRRRRACEASCGQ